MIAGTWPNLATMFFDQVERKGDLPFLWAKNHGVYESISWHQAAAEVSMLARGLQDLGVGPGDRVVLVSENRPEWAVADLAIMAAGAITVPAYVTNTEADHLHILENSGAVGAIVSTRRLARRLLPAAHRAADLKFVVAIERPDLEQHLSVDVHDWRDLLARGHHGHANVVERARALRRDETACLIYTSGTGGAPKGVMLSHGALLHNCEGARDVLVDLDLGDEVFLSFLPLSHSYEHTAGLMFPISIGAQIYYAEGIEMLATNLREVRPTIMTAVPRLYETLHVRMRRDIRKAGGLKEKLFRRAVELGIRRYHRGGGLGLVDSVVDAVLERLVRDKVRDRFGGRLKAMVSGGAPLNPEIGLFFLALGLRLLQGYGQTESAPVISFNRPRLNKIDTVGPPIKDTEVWIADDGEILVRGELVMQGYWRNEVATRETIRDGWLHTGDVGMIDADGCLKITDRKKDIIVNSGGDNLSPARVEGLLTLEAEIAQAMVYGDRRPHLVALLVPDGAWLETWAREHGKPSALDQLTDDSDLHAALSEAVTRVNGKVSTIEKVRRFVIADAPFGIDNGQMTPTLKIRRHVLLEAYGERLERLYG